MNEQQRIFVTLMACMSVWFAWATFVAPPEPPAPPAQVAAAPSSGEPARTASGAGVPTGPQPQAAAGTSVPARAAVSSAQGGVAAPSERQVQVHRRFKTAQVAGVMRSGDAGLVALDLLNYDERSRPEEPSAPVSLVAPHGRGGEPGAQATILWELGTEPAPPLSFVDQDNLVLEGMAGNGLKLRVEAVPRPEAYAIDYRLQATNPTQGTLPAGAAIELSLTPLVMEKASFFAPPTDPLHGLCHMHGSLNRHNLKDLLGKPYSSGVGTGWAALDRQYFVAAVVPEAGTQGTCSMRADEDVLSLRYALEGRLLAPGEVYTRSFSLYAGPKRDAELARVTPELQSTIDYSFIKVPLGFIARPMVALLGLFHGLSGSWGVSIMLLTLSVKLLLFPVSYKSVVSMRRVQELKPELDTIRAKYEHDRERQNLETLKLYRERGVNPMGGCLPMLLQIPVWLTLYRTLWSAVDLYQQPFLWLPDLTAPEPLPLLAVLVGAVTVVQQKLTPMAMDNPQARTMMFVMPIMFTVFMVALPSGLVLYMMTNSVLTIAQQLVINRRTGNRPKAATAA